MTAKTINSVRYPLLWIVNQYDLSDARAIPNKACKRIPRLLKFRDWLEERYKTAYQYELTEHLHEYGLDEPIPGFVGLRVTRTKLLDMKFYRRSWCDVYVDTIMRAYINVYTGDDRSPQCRKMCVDYRIRGYYDLYDRQSHLFQAFFQYNPNDDMEYDGKTPLDDYLIPFINSDNLEDEAYSCLEEIYPYVFQRSGPLNMKAVARENQLTIKLTGLSPDGKGRKARLYLYKKKGEVLFDKNGKPFTATVPANTILVERKLYYKNLLRALNSTAHELCHFGKHSLFELAQEMYRDELMEHFGIADANVLSMDAEEQKVIRVMEWQAKRLAPRIQMYTGHVEDKMDELLNKYGWCEKHAMVERIVRDLAEYFKVSKEAAKYRIQELGYLNTDGDLVFIDDAYLPAYDVPEWLKPFETFDISFDELLGLYRQDKRLQKMLHTGNFLYCEAHLCVNDKKYIEIKNGKPHLTQYAHENMIECCVLFTKHKTIVIDYKSGVFQDAAPLIDYAVIGAHFNFIGNVTDPLERAEKRNAIKRYLPNFFPDLLIFHMARLRIQEEDLEDFSGVSVSTITRYRSQNDYKCTEPKLLALSVGLSLEPDFSKDFLKKGGYSFDKETIVLDMIDFMLDTMYKEPVEVWRKYFVSHGYKGLI